MSSVRNLKKTAFTYGGPRHFSVITVQDTREKKCVPIHPIVNDSSVT